MRIVLLIFWLMGIGQSAQAGSSIIIGGSGTDLGTFRLLVKQFNARHPEITVKIPLSVGSAGAAKGIGSGVLHIGLLTRPLKEEERSLGIRQLLYARTPLVIAVHEDSKQNDISHVLLQDFLAGTRLTWPDGERLRLILRPSRDSDIEMLRSAFPEMSAALDLAYQRKGLPVALTDQEAADMIAHTPGGVGISSLALVLSERLTLKILKLDGVIPSVQTIADGSYPLSKSLYMAVNEQVSPEAQKFIDFVFSPQGAAVLQDTGHWVVKQGER
ncbi:MAG: hypothetical protein A2V90_05975 [Gammaproteobacteria bacterium RBG_16_57_12]|nr:MAG: hypothetical protein A2V90_05975 [Gammaproteobacteria bacterium RBG_16_57_12]